MKSENKITALRGELRHDEPLARHTSWHVGGRAQRYYRPADLKDLLAFLPTLSPQENLVWLGLGSNVLIRDGGIRGTVIATQGCLNQIEQLEKSVVRAEAGIPCAKMAKYCAVLGFVDAAFFAGVPGTIGGALAMNAGAFGGETWRYVVAVETVNRSGELRIRTPQEFQISYRQVIKPDHEWFVAGHFSFAASDSVQAKQAIRELLQKRAASQPMGEFSCGSVFRNPTGDFAARLIEATGLKGLRQGGAWISEKHANFIINGGEASATDIEILIEIIQQRVAQQHGVQLIPEVRFLGEKKDEKKW